MRGLLLPLTPLYAAAVSVKNDAYDHGVVRGRQLKWPVISIGNISVGGSGKTPIVIYLAKLLQQHGIQVDVLSRGYGRSSNAVELVDPAGNADRFGDEPLLITQSAGVPVYVGPSRYEAGVLAEGHRSGTGIHLLDDGFQHRKLARAADLVVVHRSDFQEKLLPAGRLREPVRALQRASVLVLRVEDAFLEQELERRGIEKPIWWVKRAIVVQEKCGKVVAFCGIARPDEFFQSLQRSGVEIAAKIAFRDHHRYHEADIQQLISNAQFQGANAFITTEKDLVRLSQSQKEALAAYAPVETAKLQIVFCDESAVLQSLGGLLPASFAHSL
jgi:tetraacyldisaccharide 4'-kinase